MNATKAKNIFPLRKNDPSKLWTDWTAAQTLDGRFTQAPLPFFPRFAPVFPQNLLMGKKVKKRRPKNNFFVFYWIIFHIHQY